MSSTLPNPGENGQVRGQLSSVAFVLSVGLRQTDHLSAIRWQKVVATSREMTCYTGGATYLSWCDMT